MHPIIRRARAARVLAAMVALGLASQVHAQDKLVKDSGAAAGSVVGATAGAAGGPVASAVGGVVGGAVGKATGGVVSAIIPGGGKEAKEKKAAQAKAEAEQQDQKQRAIAAELDGKPAQEAATAAPTPAP